jgi:hypothetical protein
MRLTLKTSSFESFTGEAGTDEDVDDVLLRFLLSPTISNLYFIERLTEFDF